jgi:hypothetical protein
LALRRQADQDALVHQRIIAQAEHEKEKLRALSQQAEMRKQVFEMEALAAERRLACWRNASPISHMPRDGNGRASKSKSPAPSRATHGRLCNWATVMTCCDY